MNRGRPPKPTALKRLQGNPGKRPLPKDEPRPSAGAPRCPAFLSTSARTEWRRIVPELESLGLLTKIDRAALAAYCQSWANWKVAEKFIAENGVSFVMRDKDGKVKYMQQFPQVAISRQERLLMHRFLTEFGLTPSSRSRAHAAAPESAEEKKKAEQRARLFLLPGPARTAEDRKEA